MSKVLTLNLDIRAQSDFRLIVPIRNKYVVTGSDASYSISSNALAGFASDIDLVVSGLPSGASATIGTNPISSDGTTIISIETVGVSPGTYSFTIEGSSAYPRLFFSEQDIAQIRTQAATTHAEIWPNIITFADTLLSNTMPDFATYQTQDDSAFQILGTILIPLGFSYVLTGESKYLTKAKEYLLHYAQNWPFWGRYYYNPRQERDMSMGFMIIGNVCVFDWIYNDLTDSEKILIKDAIGTQAQYLYEAATIYNWSIWTNWWWKSYVQNHWHICNSAIGLAGLLLEGEDNRATNWLNYASNTFMTINNYILDEGIIDGTWHEGTQYQQAILGFTLPFYYSYKRLKKIDRYPSTYINNFIMWRLYNYRQGTLQTVMNYSNYADWIGGNAFGPMAALRFAAGQLNNGYAEWLAQQMILYADVRSTEGVVLQRTTPYQVFEFLYYDPNIAAIPPTNLSKTRTFSDAESVIWRTGWGVNDLVFGFKTGAYGNRFSYEAKLNGIYPFDDPDSQMNFEHNHCDMNTFYLYKGIYSLSSEAEDVDTGRVAGANAPYHNIILVDNHNYYYPDWSRLYADDDGKLDSVLTAPDFNFLSSDVTNLQRSDTTAGNPPGAYYVDEMTRHILFVRPNYFVMVDNIRSQTDHTYSWTSHIGSVSYPSTISIQSNWIKGDIYGTNVLGINIVAPSGFTDTTGIRDCVGNPDKPYVIVNPPAPIADVRFITVLYPTTTADWTSKPSISLISDTTQAAGISVYLDGTQNHLFNYISDSTAIIGSYELIGQVASVFKDMSANTTKVFLGGKRLTDGSNSLLDTSQATAIEAVFSGTSLALYGTLLDTLRVYGPTINVNQVTLDGTSIVVTRQGDYIII